MRGFPLLLSSIGRLSGPLVPTMGRTTKVRTQGMVQGDQVTVYGCQGERRELLVTIDKVGDWVNERLKSFEYIQANIERPEGNNSHIFVWLE